MSTRIGTLEHAVKMSIAVRKSRRTKKLATTNGQADRREVRLNA